MPIKFQHDRKFTLWTECQMLLTYRNVFKRMSDYAFKVVRGNICGTGYQRLYSTEAVQFNDGNDGKINDGEIKAIAYASSVLIGAEIKTQPNRIGGFIFKPLKISLNFNAMGNLLYKTDGQELFYFRFETEYSCAFNKPVAVLRVYSAGLSLLYKDFAIKENNTSKRIISVNSKI